MCYFSGVRVVQPGTASNGNTAVGVYQYVTGKRCYGNTTIQFPSGDTVLVDTVLSPLGYDYKQTIGCETDSRSRLWLYRSFVFRGSYNPSPESDRVEVILPW